MDQVQLQNKVSEILDQIFEYVGIQIKPEFEVVENENRPLQINVNIRSTDDNLLIGYHGNTLKSIQHVIDTMIYQSFKENVEVIVDVGNYRAERKRKIMEVAESAIEKAHSFKKAIALYPMSAYERKIVHEIVSQTEDLVSSSEGEGSNRRVIISFKDQQ